MIDQFLIYTDFRDVLEMRDVSLDIVQYLIFDPMMTITAARLVKRGREKSEVCTCREPVGYHAEP